MISKNRIILMLGVWTAIVPILGFPSSWETFFAIVSGSLIAILAFLIARQKRVLPMRNGNRSEGNIEIEKKELNNSQNVFIEHDPERFTDIDLIRKNADAEKSKIS